MNKGPGLECGLERTWGAARASESTVSKLQMADPVILNLVSVHLKNDSGSLFAPVLTSVYRTGVAMGLLKQPSWQIQCLDPGLTVLRAGRPTPSVGQSFFLF